MADQSDYQKPGYARLLATLQAAESEVSKTLIAQADLVEALTGQLQTAQTLLQQLEWGATVWRSDEEYGGENAMAGCPACRRTRGENHAIDCSLDAFLMGFK